MIDLVPPPYGIKFGNIPSINLRLEFDQTLEFVNSEAFSEGLKKSFTLIEAPLFYWKGHSNDLVTLLLQRAILGVESYLPSALWNVHNIIKHPDHDLIAKLKNPASFGAKSMATNIYHRMPEAIHPELSLKYLDPEIYENTLKLYSKVRNPIFHGKQVSDPSASQVKQCFEQIRLIYSWIDHWYNPDRAHVPELKLGPLTIKMPRFVNRAP